MPGLAGDILGSITVFEKNGLRAGAPHWKLVLDDDCIGHVIHDDLLETFAYELFHFKPTPTANWQTAAPHP